MLLKEAAWKGLFIFKDVTFEARLKPVQRQRRSSLGKERVQRP